MTQSIGWGRAVLPISTQSDFGECDLRFFCDYLPLFLPSHWGLELIKSYRKAKGKRDRQLHSPTTLTTDDDIRTDHESNRYRRDSSPTNLLGRRRVVQLCWALRDHRRGSIITLRGWEVSSTQASSYFCSHTRWVLTGKKITYVQRNQSQLGCYICHDCHRGQGHLLYLIRS